MQTETVLPFTQTKPFMPQTKNGTTIQSGLFIQPCDYNHEKISYPVVGIILEVYFSDDESFNTSTSFSQTLRGNQLEAKVLIVNDGSDSPAILPNVIILPRGSSNFDDYQEEVPKGTTGTVDGSYYSVSLQGVDTKKLNGDWCVVGFIGGSSRQPVMLNWFPHPANTRDPATKGIRNTKLLQQKRRIARRFRGTRLNITSKGSIFIDTSEANSDIVEGQRKLNNAGGDIDISVKQGRYMSINFNEVVSDKDNNPDVLQENPPQVFEIRPESKTKFYMDKDFINAVAGQVVQIIGKNTQDSILLGANAQYHAILGERFEVTYDQLVSLINNLISTFNEHVHTGNGVAPTNLFTETAEDMPASNLSEVVLIE